MPHSPTYAAGAGGMRSTAEELCKWHHALLSAQVLPRTTLDLMLTPARFADGSPAVRQGPPGSPPAPANYGMGIAIANENGRRMVTHNGAINGFLGQLDSYPDQQVSIAVLMNAGPAARFAVPAPDGGQRSPGAPAAPSSPTPGQTPAAGTAPTVIRRVASAEELQALRAGAPNQVALRAALREAARIALA
jgi:CubicO group peptidase (beta-lactamase class C family)